MCRTPCWVLGEWNTASTLILVGETDVNTGQLCNYTAHALNTELEICTRHGEDSSLGKQGGR